MKNGDYEHNNSSNTCYILPNDYFPNGSNLDFHTCPDLFNSSRMAEVRCCLKIIAYKFPTTKFDHWLTYYSSSSLLAPAIAFNLLSFYVLSSFSKPNEIAKSINFYMKSLCIFDILTIISKFILEFSFRQNSIREKPYAINVIACKVISFSYFFCGLSSTYILILMSINKFISVAMPLKIKSLVLLRPKWAKINCFLVVLFSITYSLFYIFNIKFLKSGKKELSIDCSLDIRDLDFHRNIHIFDAIIKTFSPIMLLCVCNFSIIILLAMERKKIINVLKVVNIDSRSTSLNKDKEKYSKFVSKKNVNNKAKNEAVYSENPSNIHKQCLANSVTQTKNIVGSVSSEGKTLSSLKSYETISIYRKQTESIVKILYKPKKKHYSNYSSVMLLASSFGFVLLNLPYAIIAVYNLKFNERQYILNFINGQDSNNKSFLFNKSSVILAIKLDFFLYLSNFLLDLNYVTNFFFYFLSSITFRHRLYSLIQLIYKKLRNFNRIYRSGTKEREKEKFFLGRI